MRAGAYFQPAKGCQMWAMITYIRKKVGRWLIIYVCLALAVLSAACDQSALTPMPDSLHEVAPLFREFYVHLGGSGTLGPAISASFQEGEMTVQFTENAKMIFDPQANLERRFRLAPLGVQLDLIEPPVAQPSAPGQYYYYEDGHSIPADFHVLYEKLGGKPVVGSPLTEMRYNPNRRRYEQYFENLGFYRSTNRSDVYLLAYGAMVCDRTCRKDGSAFDPSKKDNGIDVGAPIHPAFRELVSRLGRDFTGFALAEAYVTPDGKLEQILENVVVEAASASQSGIVGLRPLPQVVAIGAEKPRAYSGDPQMYFLATHGKLGYEIPLYFWDYLWEHGGTPVSGLPISHLAQDGQNYRQCFVNLCLSYRSGKARPVQLEPLGFIYKGIYYRSASGGERPIPSPEAFSRLITLQAWETYPHVSAQGQQEIWALVLENKKPAQNVVLYLQLSLPDGSQAVHMMPPTGSDGKTNLLLPPIQAASGSLVNYLVCIPQPEKSAICYPESFVIWSNP